MPFPLVGEEGSSLETEGHFSLSIFSLKPFSILTFSEMGLASSSSNLRPFSLEVGRASSTSAAISITGTRYYVVYNKNSFSFKNEITFYHRKS